MNLRPLSGVRITDLTIIVAGPVATSVLGSLGAEVIKIENTLPRSVVDRKASAQTQMLRNNSFFDLNRNKFGITLNLSVPSGKELFLHLVEISDVVIDNFSPRVMRNFGLEYDDLVKINPNIIAVSMPAFGKTGPLRDRGSFGPGIDAMSGLAHLTGYPDSTPLKPGNYFCDFSAGVHAAMAVMAAIYSRRRIGKGQYIEVSMRDGETQLIGEYILEYVLNKTVQERAANFHPTMAPHNVYRCLGEDKWLAIAVGSDAEWAALCGAMNRPALAGDPRFATALARKHNEQALDAVVSEWTATQQHIPAMHFLQAAGVAAAAVLSMDELAVDPQFVHRRAVQTVNMPAGGTLSFERAAWLAKQAGIAIARGPEYSEHTAGVLGNLLSLNAADLERLADEGAILLPEPAAPKG